MHARDEAAAEEGQTQGRGHCSGRPPSAVPPSRRQDIPSAGPAPRGNRSGPAINCLRPVHRPALRSGLWRGARWSARPQLISTQVLILFDAYVHGRIDRRGFLEGAAKFAVGGMTAVMLLEALNPKFAEAQQVQGRRAPDGRARRATRHRRVRHDARLPGAADGRPPASCPASWSFTRTAA